MRDDLAVAQAQQSRRVVPAHRLPSRSSSRLRIESSGQAVGAGAGLPACPLRMRFRPRPVLTQRELSRPSGQPAHVVVAQGPGRCSIAERRVAQAQQAGVGSSRCSFKRSTIGERATPVVGQAALAAGNDGAPFSPTTAAGRC